MGHESHIEPWSPFDRRSALLASELTGFVANERCKPLGQTCPATEHMVRSVKSDPAHSRGPRRKKNCGRGRGFFLTSTFMEQIRSYEVYGTKIGRASCRERV